jgi:hypothetical protein
MEQGDDGQEGPAHVIADDERQTGNRNTSSKKAHISAQDRASALAS